MNDTELAYFTGAIDADGFFAIRRATKGNSTSFFEMLGLGQVSPIVPEMLKARFGGYITTRKRTEPAATNWRVMYYWHATTKIAANAVEELRPYLRLKCRQADIILEMRESKKIPYSQRRGTRTGVRAYTTNPDIQAHRAALHEEMIRINH